MNYFGAVLYMGSKNEGYVYEYDNSAGKITQLAKLPTNNITGKAIIDTMTTYA